jgi:CO/xanthine dehydrogenase FAD-binding subunit
VGERRLAIRDFFRGYRQTDLRPGELIREITFTALPENAGSSFVKFGLRQAQAISVVMTSAVLEVEAGRISRACVALGAVAPLIIRSRSAEKLLLGKIPSHALFGRAGEAARADISPIDDIRASKQYRSHITKPLVQKALEIAWQRIRTIPEGGENVA